MKPLLVALTLGLAVPATAALAPAPAVAAKAEVPFTTVTLPGSGVAIHAAEDARLPRVWYELHFEAGERFAPADRAGMTALAAEVLNRGPAGIPYEDYRRTLFHLGAEISWQPGNRFLTAKIKSPPGELPRVTALVKRAATEPRLDAETFSLLKTRLVNQRRAMDDDMRALTFHYGKQKLWDFRPESRLPEGWVDSIARIERAELFGFLRTMLAAPEAFVSAAGPMSASTLATALEQPLAGWVRPFVAERSGFPEVAPARRVLLIDKPGATDNQIYMLSPYPVSLTSSEAAAAEVFLAGMGAGLGARLGKTLRVERGLTYHASSGLRRGEWPSWYAYSFGGDAQTPKIVSGLYELFGKARAGLAAQEVAQAKDQLLKGVATGMETPPEQMAEVAWAVSQGLPASYPFDRPRLIEAVTAEAVNAQAARIGSLERATLFIMGDARTIKAPIAEALPEGTPIVVRTIAEISAEARSGDRHP